MSVARHQHHDGRVMEVVVDRPTALNAVDFGVMEGLEAALDHAESSAELCVFAVRGAGSRSFLSGGDLKSFATLETAREGAAMASRMLAILARIEALEAITVAGVNGPAYGGGTETALAFDIRVAAAHATFGFTQAKFAVPPGWGGLTRMVELVGRSRALHWLATTSVVSAETALEAGLVNVVAPEDAFDAVLETQLERMVRLDKSLLTTLKEGARRATTLDRSDAIAAELDPFARHWGSDAHHERVKAFLDKE